jgi:hypothetical protein
MSGEKIPLACTRSRHAQRQNQRRATKKAHVEIVLEHGDVDLPVGGGCYKIMISTRRQRFLVSKGIISPQEMERCRRLVVVASNSHVVTAYKQDL